MSEQEELLADVARYYYVQNLTQEEIGRRINASRSTVSRLLQQALETGLVKITINYPWERDRELEKKLTEKFGLCETRVLVGKDRNEEEIRKGTGVLAARLVDAYVKDGSILGISYGRSPASTVAALAPNRQVAITVVPIIGALGSDNFEIDGPELIRSLAQIYGGKYRYLPAPLLVKDTRTRDTLVQSGKIYDILALARKAHIALLGIGAPGSGVSSLIWGGYLNKRELALVSEQGAVGHMCGQFFDREGNLLDVELNHRVIGIGLKALQKIKTVIVAAGGEAKAAAILGALRGRYLNVLVTDDAAARKILALASSS